MADYGIPQVRKRAIIVAIHLDEPCLIELENANSLPWPRTTHAEYPTKGKLPWLTVGEWFDFMQYPTLDACDEQSARFDADPLHFVPSYENEGDRYCWVSDIPPRSGRSAFQNSNCRNCNQLDVPEGEAFCPSCGCPMINRPYVSEEGNFRLVKGFASSYRRMHPSRPAPTVMTNSSHLGSDYNVHPWENRVLSIRECAELQTIPRFYDWNWALDTRHSYVARQVIGEALPPFFTYLHGKVLLDLLANRVKSSTLAQRS
jgi:DNA (cytosine-5)-methyltransferase 1